MKGDHRHYWTALTLAAGIIIVNWNRQADRRELQLEIRSLRARVQETERRIELQAEALTGMTYAIEERR